MGGKLAYRLRRTAGGHWTVTHGMVVGDVLMATSALEQVVRALKGEQPEGHFPRRKQDQGFTPLGSVDHLT